MLGLQLYELLFQPVAARYRTVDRTTNGHLYQEWHAEAHHPLRQPERRECVVQIEHHIYLMFELNCGAEVMRQLRKWNDSYAPHPKRDMRRRITMENINYVKKKPKVAGGRQEASTDDPDDE